ncbi:ion transporter, partial [bacterium]|nr:ion transporter [candidate division CSSED10-310 bacterium]
MRQYSSGLEQETETIVAPWRRRLHEVIFEADTTAGKAFDVVLLIAIVLSVAAVMLESVQAIEREYGGLLRVIEWFFT